MKADVLALLAAFAFALGNVLQQRGPSRRRPRATILDSSPKSCGGRCGWPEVGARSQAGCCRPSPSILVPSLSSNHSPQ